MSHIAKQPCTIFHILISLGLFSKLNVLFIRNCSEANITGVELRVEHAHEVTLDLTTAERSEVKKKFADSPVIIVGIGTNEQYDWPEPDKLKTSIETTKKWLQLSKDIGGSGVKVKPNQFHEGIPKEKTLEQIGKALNEFGKHALGMGQQIRMEVHGEGTQELPNIKTIMDYVENKGTTVCFYLRKWTIKAGFCLNVVLIPRTKLLRLKNKTWFGKR